jgi:hypothetical protein
MPSVSTCAACVQIQPQIDNATCNSDSAPHRKIIIVPFNHNMTNIVRYTHAHMHTRMLSSVAWLHNNQGYNTKCIGCQDTTKIGYWYLTRCCTSGSAQHSSTFFAVKLSGFPHVLLYGIGFHFFLSTRGLPASFHSWFNLSLTNPYFKTIEVPSSDGSASNMERLTLWCRIVAWWSPGAVFQACCSLG